MNLTVHSKSAADQTKTEAAGEDILHRIPQVFSSMTTNTGDQWLVSVHCMHCIGQNEYHAGSDGSILKYMYIKEYFKYMLNILQCILNTYVVFVI